MDIVRSINDVPIRLTNERRAHIVEEHGELAAMRLQILVMVAEPIAIDAGGRGERLAIQMVESGKRMVVIYRETNGDGFIITAFMTRRIRSLERRVKIWP